MSIDTSEVGIVAARLMDDIETEHADEDLSIGVVMLIVELCGQEETLIRYRCSDERLWIQRGLLAEAGRVTEVVEDAEDD